MFVFAPSQSERGQPSSDSVEAYDSPSSPPPIIYTKHDSSSITTSTRVFGHNHAAAFVGLVIVALLLFLGIGGWCLFGRKNKAGMATLRTMWYITKSNVVKVIHGKGLTDGRGDTPPGTPSTEGVQTPRIEVHEAKDDGNEHKSWTGIEGQYLEEVVIHDSNDRGLIHPRDDITSRTAHHLPQI